MAAAVMYACSNACIGATPAAYAADVMPSNISGFALGIYRCAGDIGVSPLHHLCALACHCSRRYTECTDCPLASCWLGLSRMLLVKKLPDGTASSMLSMAYLHS